MRLEQLPRLPRPGGDWSDWTLQAIAALQKYLDRVSQQVNLSSEGYLRGATNATTAAPTTGTYARGDFVRNSMPSEAGSAPNKYVIYGWLCTTAGSPGTWRECRFLTGN